MISLIVAHDEERGIGKDNGIPWFIPGELKWVAEKTKEVSSKDKLNALIMGHNTWLSISEERRPLPGRFSLVISSKAEINHPMVKVFRSLDDAIKFAKESGDIENGFIFGGSSIYKEALASDWLDELLVAKVPGKHDADIFFPDLPDAFEKVSEQPYQYGETTVLRETWRKRES
tara:strand:- start:52 stop:573 length:522 start_codon:yes stop_codon:yes gene_type:complete